MLNEDVASVVEMVILSFPAHNKLTWREKRTARIVVIVFILFFVNVDEANIHRIDREVH
jgi:hypothetical protein